MKPAAISLQRARSIGFDGNQELESVVRYHTALLYIRFGEFEITYQILMEFLRIGNSGPKIVEAFGLVILRLPFLPNEVPAEKREEVLLAGQAGIAMGARHLDEARKAFDTLVTAILMIRMFIIHSGSFNCRRTQIWPLKNFSGHWS